MKKNLIYLTIIFIATRLVIDQKVPFWYDTINNYMQYLDPEILRHNLAQGIWYLHTQPPLFNLFLGLVLKLGSGKVASAVFAGLFFLMGMAVALGSYVLMRKLQVSSRLAFIASVCIMVFPPLVRAERWLFYPYPLATLTILAALALCYFELGKKYKWFLLFCLALAIVVLSRSLYHLILFMLPSLLLVLVWVYARKIGNTKKYLLAAAILFLLASSIYVKNYAQYGIFSSSTWQGMNLMEMTYYIPQDIKQQMVDKGQVTPLALVHNTSAPQVYFDYFHLQPARGNPVIDNLVKSTGSPNFNNYIYAKMGAESQHNALVLISHHPLDYLKAVANETYIFFLLSLIDILINGVHGWCRELTAYFILGLMWR